MFINNIKNFLATTSLSTIILLGFSPPATADDCVRTGTAVSCDSVFDSLQFYADGTTSLNLESEDQFTPVDTGPTNSINITGATEISRLDSGAIAVVQHVPGSANNNVTLTINVLKSPKEVIIDEAGEDQLISHAEFANAIQTSVNDGSLAEAEANSILAAFSSSNSLFTGGASPNVTDLFTGLEIFFLKNELEEEAGDDGKVDSVDIRDILPSVVSEAQFSQLIDSLTFDENGRISVELAQQSIETLLNTIDIDTTSSFYRPEQLWSGGNEASTVYVSTGSLLNDIQTSGDISIINNAGIFNLGHSPFDSSNPILTSFYNTALLAETYEGNIDITNTGNITVAGYGGKAIFGFANIGDVSVMNSGDISIGGREAEGIIAVSSDSGNVSIVNTGHITLLDAIAYDPIDNSQEYSKGLSATIADFFEGSEMLSARGDISIENSGTIDVYSQSSTAIIADNYGTGEININNSGAINIFANESWAIDAIGYGHISVTNTGDIMSVISDTASDTQSRFSHGIVATLLDSGTARNLTITNNADILMQGEDNQAIIASNVDGTTFVDLQGGTVQGGYGSRDFNIYSSSDGFRIEGSAGVTILSDGGTATVQNAGVITSLNGLAINSFDGDTVTTNCDLFNEDGTCNSENITTVVHTFASSKDIINNLSTGQILGDIELNGGDDEIHNQGLIVGNVDLGEGNNVFNNMETGTLFSGETVHVGAGNVLNNAGTFSPGGVDQIIRTNLVGNYVQTATGSLVIDIDDRETESSDVVQVTGTANLRGTIIPNIINLEAPNIDFVALTAEGGIQDNGLMVQDTVGFDFSLGLSNDDTYLILSAESVGSIAEIVENSPPATGTTPDANTTRLTTTLAAIESSGSTTGTELVNSLRLLSSNKEVAKAVERLIPKSQEKTAGNAVSNNVSFSNAMLSCKQYEGPNRFTKEGQCYWGKVTGRRFDRDATSEHSGSKETAYELTTGIQYALENELRVGFALGFEDSNSDSFSQSQVLGTSEGKAYRGGIVFKNQWGAFNAYLNLMGNYARLDHKRIVNLPGLGAIASAKQDVSSGLGRIRFSYLFDQGPWYVKPILDVDATYLHLGGYTETGAGAANMRIESSNEWLFGSTLSLEIGGEQKLSNGGLIRPYIRGGVRFISEDDIDTTVNFAGAPVGLAPFQVNSKLEDVFGEVEAGVHLVSTNGLNLHMMYEGRFSEDSEQHAGSVKAGINF